VNEEIEIRGGFANPPTRPGIGIDVDESAAARYPYAPESDFRTFDDDGAVIDW
jgi:galactonate dehydratase